jgi:hypothetical protein
MTPEQEAGKEPASRATVENEQDQALANAIVAAEQLLSYAAEHGSDIGGGVDDGGIIDTVVRTKRLFQGSGVTADDESKFWDAYRKLSIATAPVTRESLEATTQQPRHIWLINRNVSPAGKAVRYYQGVTIFAIMVLLVFQIYWVFVSTLENDLKTLRDALHTADLAMVAKSVELRRISPDSKLKNAISELQWDSLGPDASDEEIRARDLQVQALEEERKKLWGALSDSDREKLVKLQGELEILDRDPKTNQISREIEVNLELLRKVDLVGRILNEEQLGDAPVSTSDQSLFSITTGNISLQILSLYLLPILYGLVGACAYILRTISREIRMRTFTAALKINLQLRLVLGALAGFSVAWFVGGEGDATIVGNVTPLALAFLAGYSVELLFSAMDTLVEAFSRRGSEK